TSALPATNPLAIKNYAKVVAAPDRPGFVTKMNEVRSSEELEKEKERAEAPQTEFYFRILIAFAAIGTLISHIDWEKFNLVFYFFVFWVIYPVFAYVVTRKLLFTLELVSRISAGMDAFFLGMLVHIIDFGLMPGLMFLTIILCQALITGGFRKCGEDLTAYVVGILSVYVYYDAEFNPLGDIHGSLASLIGISVYFIIYSF